VLKHDGKRMTLTPKQLKEDHKGVGVKRFKSKINPGETYHLIDYKWVPDKDQLEMAL